MIGSIIIIYKSIIIKSMSATLWLSASKMESYKIDTGTLIVDDMVVHIVTGSH